MVVVAEGAAAVVVALEVAVAVEALVEAVVEAAMEAALREGAAATRGVAGEARLAPFQALPVHETLSPSQVPVM